MDLVLPKFGDFYLGFWGFRIVGVGNAVGNTKKINVCFES